MSEQEQYRKIVKNTAVLGGSQIVQMLATLVRTKIIAVLLGPAGMGINALVLTAIALLQQLSSFGIFPSGVRELSHANTLEDKTKIATLRKVFIHLTVLCGVIGVVLCMTLAPLLSLFSFGDYSYGWSFVAVAPTLFFMSLQSGYSAIMQATQNLRLLAKSTIFGAVFNLITIPMFWFWGVNGIVPAIVVGYLVFWLVNRYFEHKIVVLEVASPTKMQTIAKSKPIVKLGLVLMVSNLLMVTFTFLLNGFISNVGSVGDVGLFQSASSICMQSMIIINTTLISDYFPRISTVHRENDKLKTILNNQSEVMFYFIGVISALLIVCAPWIVQILLSDSFVSIVPLLQIMSLSFIFRVLWMIFGLTIVSKGDKILYFIVDAMMGHGMLFLINIGAYYFWGIDGLGYSYLVGAAIMVVILAILNGRKYKITLSTSNVKLFAVLVILLTFVYVSYGYLSGIWGVVLSFSVAVVICAYCTYKLNQKLGLKQMIINKMKG